MIFSREVFFSFGYKNIAGNQIYKYLIKIIICKIKFHKKIFLINSSQIHEKFMF